MITTMGVTASKQHPICSRPTRFALTAHGQQPVDACDDGSGHDRNHSGSNDDGFASAQSGRSRWYMGRSCPAGRAMVRLIVTPKRCHLEHGDHAVHLAPCSEASV
jgi:hypothetical protein